MSSDNLPEKVAPHARPANLFHPVTIADIIAGTVKHTHVLISGVTVRTLHNENDGDAHMHVTGSSQQGAKAETRLNLPVDPAAPAFFGNTYIIYCGEVAVPADSLVCEMIPELPSINVPNIGDIVNISGILRFDKQHQWAEIHPVLEMTYP